MKLFCKHNYKFYNTQAEMPLFATRAINNFQYVCTKCGSVKSVDEWEISDMYETLKERYHRMLALGGEEVAKSRLTIPRHHNCDICYDGPVATLMIEKMLKKGIDLREIH